MRRAWPCALALVVIVAATCGAQARKLTHADLLGTWCGDKSKYVFTRNSLAVAWYGSSDRRVLQIREWSFSEKWINVKWKPKGNTVFSEFSVDNQAMAQEPNTTGDMGPRRPFRRCK